MFRKLRRFIRQHWCEACSLVSENEHVRALVSPEEVRAIRQVLDIQQAEMVEKEVYAAWSKKAGLMKIPFTVSLRHYFESSSAPTSASAVLTEAIDQLHKDLRKKGWVVETSPGTPEWSYDEA